MSGAMESSSDSSSSVETPAPPAPPPPKRKRAAQPRDARDNGQERTPLTAATLPNEKKLFVEVLADVRFTLSPVDFGATFSGVRASEKILSPLVMRHVKALGGVMISHRGVTFPDISSREAQTEEASKTLLAELDPAAPVAHVRARARCLVFAPRRGALLTGAVRFVGKDHISLRVWKVFNAVIIAQDAPKSYKYVRGSGSAQRTDSHNPESVRMVNGPTNVAAWVHDGSDGKNIVVGTRICFSVQALRHADSGLITLKGSLVADERCGVVSGSDGDNADDDDFLADHVDGRTAIALSRKRDRTSFATGAANTGDPDPMESFHKRRRRRSAPDTSPL